MFTVVIEDVTTGGSWTKGLQDSTNFAASGESVIISR